MTHLYLIEFLPYLTLLYFGNINFPFLAPRVRYEWVSRLLIKKFKIETGKLQLIESNTNIKFAILTILENKEILLVRNSDVTS